MMIQKKSIVIATIALVLFLTTILLPINGPAQEPKAQQPTQKEIQETIAQLMGPMMEVMIEAMFTIMAKPENAERLATFTKNYYDALIAKGFSKEDALEIVTMTGMPSMPGVQ